MANFYGKTRTNYFAVKDAEKFLTEISMLPAEVITNEQDGETLYGFMDDSVNGDGLPFEIYDSEADLIIDIEWVKFIQKHIVPGWAAIIFNIGSEKYRYFEATTHVITDSEVKILNLEELTINTAINELNSENVTAVRY